MSARRPRGPTSTLVVVAAILDLMARAERQAPVPMTVEEWSELDDDVAGELVDGRLVEEEVPSYAHEIVVGWMLRVLAAWIHPRGGFALPSETKIRIRRDRGRKPDVLVFFPGRPLPARRARLTAMPPDIVIETVTPTRRDRKRDRVEKRDEYAEVGIPRYWIVDPEKRSLTALALGAGGTYEEVLVAARGAHATPGCDGLVLELDELWAELDRWPLEGS